MSKEVGEEYLSSLTDLNVNSKPLINMLTILAEENIQHAAVIVQAIEQHLAKVNPEVKLPILYLVDSIVKNVGGEYKQLFSQCIVNMFCGVFEKVNEKIREKLFALRQTWTDVFPHSKLCALDIKVQNLDPGWPIIAKVPTKSPSIHVNPNFLKKETAPVNDDVQAQLREKQRKLLELQKRKLELELVATKKKIEEQEREITNIVAVQSTSNTIPEQSLLNNTVPMASTTLAPSRTLINTTVNPLNPPNNGQLPTPSQGPHTRVRVAPVNPALLTSVFRSRDPRLIRQQQQHLQQQQQIQQQLHQNAINLNNLNNSTGNNPIQLTNVSSSIIEKCDSDSVSHGISNNINFNKNQLPKIPKYPKQQNNNSNTNLQNSSNVRSNLNLTKKSSSSAISKSVSTTSPSSKTKGRSQSTSSSKTSIPSSNKLRDNKNSSSAANRDEKKRTARKRSTSPPLRSNHNEKSPKRSSEPRSKSSNSPSFSPTSQQSSSNNVKIKDLKISTKNRNYMRRNRIESKSPSPSKIDKPINTKQDVDLRIGTSSVPNIDKKIKLDIKSDLKPATSVIDSKVQNSNDLQIGNKIASNLLDASSKDIDLRQLPTILTNISSNTESSPDSKKRQSNIETSNEEPVTKRMKNEKIDELFGSEDVDLRKINSNVSVESSSTRPITPPPPVITPSEPLEPNLSWAKLKGDVPKKSVTPTGKSNLDAVRAKFAEATKKVKSRNELKSPEVKLSSKKNKSGDIDLRIQNEVHFSDETSQECTDTNIKIMMVQAQEQLSNKHIDVEEYGSMIKQIFEINENKKIREAERREMIKRKSIGGGNAWQQNGLTPISDDEIGFSSAESETEDSSNPKPPKDRLRFKKKKEVIIPQIPPSKESPNSVKTLDIDVKPVVSIESSYAQSTAAELRNNASKWPEKEERWNKLESHTRWASPWEPTAVANIPPTANTWNIRSNVLIPNAQTTTLPTITPFGNTAIPSQILKSPWQNAPFKPPVLLQSNNALLGIPQKPMDNSNITKDDVVRKINIDQIPREIRFYDDIAIAFMNWDEPKEIGFQSGQRRVVVDDKETIVLGFNEPNKKFTIDNKVYDIRLGSPTREIYIDNMWYECFFGDPPIGIPLDGKVRIFKVDGPPPPVKIGNLRQDLVVGKINLIIDARNMVPIFLDSKVQYFEIDGQLNTVQFADYLLTVLINNEPYSVEFGGLPKSLFVRGTKHFVRFTALPSGIVPGKVFIRNMCRTNLNRDLVSPPAPAIVSLNDVPQSDSHLQQNNVDAGLGLQSFPVQENTAVLPIMETALPNLDFLSNLLPKPQIKTSLSTSNFDSFKTEAQDTTTDVSVPLNTLSQPIPSVSGNNNLLGNINIDDLYQKILAAGLFSKPAVSDKPKDEKKSKEKDKIKPIDLLLPETIKTRQSGIVFQLFSGMQCSSCGVRFPPEQTMKYSQHLDWHFRQNRRDRDSARRAHSRRWYYDVSDWIQYEEIEDLEEREKNFFETQQTEMDVGQDDSNHKSDSPPPSCAAGPDDVDKTCDMCHDPFEQFYNEEREEWHLRSAIRIDDKTYHPLCYEDYKASLTLDETAINASQNDDSTTDDKLDVKKEKDLESVDDSVNIIEDLDDDDVIEITPQEPVVTEILDEDEEMPAASEPKLISDAQETTTTENTTEIIKPNDSVGGESDVEIDEPYIPVTNLDDIEDIPENEKSVSDETRMSNGSPFSTVKIKEEPRDEYEEEEEDAFEEVSGTICDVADSFVETNDAIEYVPESVPESSHIPTHASIDGNESQEPTILPSSNKIKINIASKIQHNLAIPSLSNINAPTNVALHTEDDGTKDELNDDKGEEIEFEFKENLKNVKFTKIEKIESGYETSGLCSIM